MKLRRYLLRSQILVIALPICILSVFMFQYMAKSMQDEKYNKNDMIAHVMGKHVSEMLDDPVRLLKQIRALYDGGRGVPPEKTDLLVAQIMEQEPFFESVEIVDTNGFVKHSIPENQGLINFDRSRQEFFQYMKKGEEIYWSSSFISERTGCPTVMLAIPMGTDVFVGYLNLERISDLSEAFKESFGNDTFITVTDANGVFISHFEHDRVLQRQTADNFVSLNEHKHTGGTNYRMNISGKEMLVNFLELDNPQWYIIVYQSYDSAFTILRRMEILFGLVAVFVFVGAILLSRKQMGDAIKAFVLLNRRFSEIADGDFSGQAETGKFVELNEMARHFNRMVTSIKERDERLQYMAYQDPLTGLPNRVCFTKWISEAVATAGSDSKFAVVFLDLDNFKTINDTHGHWRGDEVLQAVAERLQEAVAEGSLLARLGGDEFVFIVKGWNEDQGLEWVKTIPDLLVPPIELGGYSFYTGLSIGVAVYPDDSRNADELLRYADMAMYQAKGNGKNGYQFYNAEMSAVFQRKTKIKEALRSALSLNELTLNYQPLVTSDGSRLRGFEALIRWNSGCLGLVSPIEFIAIAEETGLINNIGRWVLWTACAKLADLTAKTGMEMIIAVNVSALQLKDAKFISDVAAALAAYNLCPAQLELEITESAVIDSMEVAVAVLQQLRQLGVRVSLDDFGTGYSALSYLHHLPIDTIKIDKSFFRDIVNNYRGQDMLAGIAFLSRKLGLTIVAEGIENKEQVAYIVANDCDFAQGYYYKKPMPEHEVESFCLYFKD